MSATINQETLLSPETLRQAFAKVFNGWNDEQISDFCELAEIYRTERDPEIIETLVEMLAPDSLGTIEYDAQVSETGANRTNVYQQKIGSVIRSLRADKGWSQTKLAKIVGVTQSHVCRIENGIHTPTDVTIRRFAKALDVPVSQIDPGSE